LSAYQDACRAAVRTYEGFIARYMGDGILVYFGYPTAREDSVECAVRAGLAIVGAMESLNAAYRDTVDSHLAVRVGIATGQVVVGDIIGEGAAEEAAVTGEAPNLAARLQSLAQPDQVVVSETTRTLVGGLFEFEDLGRRQLKGISGPVEVTRVLRERGQVSRFDARVATVHSPLVGRDKECAQLRRAWDSARQGNGRITLVSGEAGIGKSRLVEAATREIQAQGRPVLRFQCSKFHTNTQLYPLINELHAVAGIATEDDAESRLDKLQALLSLHTVPASEVAPLHLLALFMRIPTGGRFPPLDISPTRRKTLLFQGILQALSLYSASESIALVFEDAHWMDPTTLDLLALAAEQVSELNVLLIVTHRPDFLPEWGMKDSVDILRVSRLDASSVKEMVEHLSNGSDIAADTFEQIWEKTAGVPLFVEELARMVQEQGGENGAGKGPIPATIQDLLRARLDHLGEAKKLAQLASCMGRSFQRQRLEEVAELPEEAFRIQFDRLVASGMSVAAGEERPDTYLFSHALAQEVAYGSLLRARRSTFHERIGLAMEKHPVEDFQLAELAHHFSHTDDHGKALNYWKLAGLHAIDSSAYVEASSHFKHALEEVPELDAVEAPAQELELRVLGAAPMTLTRGWAHPDVGDFYRRANDLCGEDAESALLFPILHGIFRYYLVTGQNETARAIADRDLAKAQQSGDDGVLLEFLLHPGVQSFYTGSPKTAISFLDRCLALHTAGDYADHPETYAGCPATIAHSHRANALAVLGKPREAFRGNRAAAEVAAQSRHVFSQIWAISNFVMNNILYDDYQRCSELARQMIERAEEQEFPNWKAQGMAWLGWSLAREGDISAGLATLNGGIEIWDATGARLMTPFYQALLADVYFMAGRLGEARAANDRSLQITAETGECWSAPLARQTAIRIDHGSGDSDLDSAFRRMRALSRAAATRGEWLWVLAAEKWIVATANEAGLKVDRQALRDVVARFPRTDPYPLVRAAAALVS